MAEPRKDQSDALRDLLAMGGAEPRDPAEAVRELLAKAERHTQKNPPPGQIMPDGSVCLGQWQPKDGTGRSLGQTFNVFAAQEDLPIAHCEDYSKIVGYVSGLTNWHGHDGEGYDSDAALIDVLKNGKYKGGWVIPPRVLLHGYDARHRKVKDNNIYDLRGVDGLKGTFNTTISQDKSWYVSCTESVGDYGISIVRFANGDKAWQPKDANYMSCRLVRLEPVGKGGPS